MNHSETKPMDYSETMKMNYSKTRVLLASLALIVALLPAGCLAPSSGENHVETLSKSDRARMDSSANAALNALYKSNPAARKLGKQAKAVLVFPDMVKGGFMFGGQLGNGVMRQKGRTIGYYNLTAASYGFQAGLQSFGYALFLMNDSALDYINSSAGWEVGVGPSLVILDEGMAQSMTTTTLRDDVYAIVFNQAGLMAGAGLQGSKITRIDQ
jgi:lipid-binding SYLF domain-containing protein